MILEHDTPCKVGGADALATEFDVAVELIVESRDQAQ